MEQIQGLLAGSDIDSDDLKNLSIAALLMRLSTQTSDPKRKDTLTALLDLARKAGVADMTPESIGIKKG